MKYTSFLKLHVDCKAGTRAVKTFCWFNEVYISFIPHILFEFLGIRKVGCVLPGSELVPPIYVWYHAGTEFGSKKDLAPAKSIISSLFVLFTGLIYSYAIRVYISSCYLFSPNHIYQEIILFFEKCFFKTVYLQIKIVSNLANGTIKIL